MFLGSTGALQSQNIDDAQKAKGISVPGKLYRQYDVNYSLGGPIVKDRLWYFFTGRNWAYDQYAANAFKPDGSQYADINILQSYPLRLTRSSTKNNKLTAMFNWTNRVRQNYVDSQPDADAGSDRRAVHPGRVHRAGKWTSTLSSQLLLEAGYNLTNHHVVYAYKDASFITPATLLRGVQSLPARNQLRQHRAPGHADRRGLHRPVSRHRRRAGTRGSPVEIAWCRPCR